MGQTRRQRPLRARTQSPVALARESLRMVRAGLEAYSSHFSRKDFTQPQLFAIRMLRQFFRTDYRGIAQMLQDFSDLRSALGLKKVPHYSTLCYAEARLPKKGLSPVSARLARDYQASKCECLFRVLTHNLMILKNAA